MKKLNSSQRKLLDDIFYNDEGGEGAFSSFLPLWRRARRDDPQLTQKMVKEYLQEQGAYMIHKRVLR